jgi:hypothetical protein
LGAAPSDAYGHYKLSGQELVELAIRFMRRLDILIPDLEKDFYTAAWFWNSQKLRPHVDVGEHEWPLWNATYPYDPKQLPGLPPRYSKDVLSPYEIDPRSKPVPVFPWNVRGTVAGWQWTSKGRGAVDGYCPEKVFMDRNIFFTIEPPIPTDADELRHLVEWEKQHGYIPLERWK